MLKWPWDRGACARRLRAAVVLAGFMLLSCSGSADRLVPPNAASLRSAPITAAPGPAGDLLRELSSRSALAGNVGDVYDNRDRGHSTPNLPWFPQLQRLEYDPAQREAGEDWALARTIRPYITIGNSSTSAEPDKGGSNPRHLVLNPNAVVLGFQQYLHGNLYVYPEHKDYDPGVFGINHHGDAYPLNTPFVVVSRGSSGSDQEFLHALLWTLAAFQPEVKQQLYARKLLVPTLQMILRRSLKDVHSDRDYLSGMAHPPAFDGDRLDPEAMIQLAHRIAPADLPPLALLQVVEESPSELGRDYFLPQQPEQWVTTPAAVGRIYRGPRPAYRMVLDGGISVDANDRELTYEWRVLRGDADRITIRPTGEHGERAEVTIPFHNEAWPAPDDPSVMTRRVDIGLFVHNGRYYSPPAIVSLYMPEHERMTLDDAGRVLEIGYGAMTSAFAGDPDNLVRDRDWSRLLTHLTSDAPAATVLRDALSPEQRQNLERLESNQSSMARGVNEREQQLARAEAALKQTTDELERKRLERTKERAEAFLERARRAVSAAVLQSRDPATGLSTWQTVAAALKSLHDDPQLFFARQETMAQLKVDPTDLLRRLAAVGLAHEDEDGLWTLTPLRSDGELTVFERNLVDALNAAVLHKLTQGMTPEPTALEPDPRLALPHLWRDVYHYDDAGDMAGWTRYTDGKQLAFTADGKLAPDDPQAAPTPVTYAPAGDDLWSAHLEMQTGSADAPAP